MEDQVQQLVSEYKAGKVSRRQFLQRAALILGGVASANALLLAANGAPFQQVIAAANQVGTAQPTSAATMAATQSATQSADIETSMVTFKGGTEDAPGYLARPKGAGPFPAIVLIQEWWGLDDHIKNVTERFAAQGYATLAPDLYRGVVAKEPSDAQRLVMKVQMDQALKDIQGAVDYLISQDFVAPKKAGVVGFCFGGGLAIMMAYKGQNVGAVVSFYGNAAKPTDDDLKQVSAPWLGLYAEKDSVPESQIREWETKLKQFGKINQMIYYKGAQHAFFNDTRPSYNKEAATDAWARTLAWFGQYLSANGSATPGATMAATSAATAATMAATTSP